MALSQWPGAVCTHLHACSGRGRRCWAHRRLEAGAAGARSRAPAPTRAPGRAQVSYKSYWIRAILEVLHAGRGTMMSIQDVSNVTGIHPNDVRDAMGTIQLTQCAPPPRPPLMRPCASGRCCPPAGLAGLTGTALCVHARRRPAHVGSRLAGALLRV
jgi:hypothetical protein